MLGGADPEAPGSSLRLDGLVPGRYRLVDLESGAASAPATVREQSQQIQQDYKKALDSALNQPRPESAE